MLPTDFMRCATTWSDTKRAPYGAHLLSHGGGEIRDRNCSVFSGGDTRGKWEKNQKKTLRFDRAIPRSSTYSELCDADDAPIWTADFPLMAALLRSTFNKVLVRRKPDIVIAVHCHRRAIITKYGLCSFTRRCWFFRTRTSNNGVL